MPNNTSIRQKLNNESNESYFKYLTAKFKEDTPEESDAEIKGAAVRYMASKANNKAAQALTLVSPSLAQSALLSNPSQLTVTNSLSVSESTSGRATQTSRSTRIDNTKFGFRNKTAVETVEQYQWYIANELKKRDKTLSDADAYSLAKEHIETPMPIVTADSDAKQSVVKVQTSLAEQLNSQTPINTSFISGFLVVLVLALLVFRRRIEIVLQHNAFTAWFKLYRLIIILLLLAIIMLTYRFVFGFDFDGSAEYVNGTIIGMEQHLYFPIILSVIFSLLVFGYLYFQHIQIFLRKAAQIVVKLKLKSLWRNSYLYKRVLSNLFFKIFLLMISVGTTLILVYRLIDKLFAQK